MSMFDNSIYSHIKSKKEDTLLTSVDQDTQYNIPQVARKRTHFGTHVDLENKHSKSNDATVSRQSLSMHEANRFSTKWWTSTHNLELSISVFFWLNLSAVFPALFWFRIDTAVGEDVKMLEKIAPVWLGVVTFVPIVLHFMRCKWNKSPQSFQALMYLIFIVSTNCSFFPYPAVRLGFLCVSMVVYIYASCLFFAPVNISISVCVALAVRYAAREFNPVWEGGVGVSIVLALLLGESLRVFGNALSLPSKFPSSSEYESLDEKEEDLFDMASLSQSKPKHSRKLEKRKRKILALRFVNASVTEDDSCSDISEDEGKKAPLSGSKIYDNINMNSLKSTNKQNSKVPQDIATRIDHLSRGCSIVESIRVVVLALWYTTALLSIPLVFGSNAVLLRWSHYDAQENGWMLSVTGLIVLLTMTNSRRKKHTVDVADTKEQIEDTHSPAFYGESRNIYMAFSVVGFAVTSVFLRYSSGNIRLGVGIAMFVFLLDLLPEIPKRLQNLSSKGSLGVTILVGWFFLAGVTVVASVQFGGSDTIYDTFARNEPGWILFPFGILMTLCVLFLSPGPFPTLILKALHHGRAYTRIKRSTGEGKSSDAASSPTVVLNRNYRRVGIALAFTVLWLAIGITIRVGSDKHVSALVFPTCMHENSTNRVSRRFRIVSWNLLQGFDENGFTSRHLLEQAFEDITDRNDNEHIIWALQESETTNLLAGNTDLTGYLARKFGLVSSFAHEDVNGYREPFRNAAGTTLLWSKSLVRDVATRTLPDGEDGMIQTWIASYAEMSCRRVLVINVRLPYDRPEIAHSQLATIVAYIDNELAMYPNLPVVVIGDLNVTPDSNTAQLLSSKGFEFILPESFTYEEKHTDYIAYKNLQLIEENTATTTASGHNPIWADFHVPPV